MKRRANTLDAWLVSSSAKEPKVIRDIQETPSSLRNEPSCSNNQKVGNGLSVSHNEPSCSKNQSQNDGLTYFIFDIGKAVGQVDTLNDFQKYQYLKNTWKPDSSYEFPFSEHNKNNKVIKRYLSYKVLERYDWLAFSEKSQGLFCKYGVIFSKDMGNIKLQSLVFKPVTKFAKLFGKKDGILDTHDKNDYHKKAIISASLFLKSYKNPSFDIRNQLSSARERKIEENRNRLRPIIKTIVFLGRQNIPLRGHRDDGSLFAKDSKESEDCEDTACNEGNFREALRFRVDAGDTTLKEHLATTTSRATYIGKRTQNELVDSCKDEILSVIIQKIKNAGFYSIIFDETTNNSHSSQMSIVIRHVEGNIVREDFVSFVDSHLENYSTELNNDTLDPVLNGKILGEIVVSKINQFGLPIDNCVGICTDGCSVMTSNQVGAVQEIQKSAKLAIRCACYNHALNLGPSSWPPHGGFLKF